MKFKYLIGIGLLLQAFAVPSSGISKYGQGGEAEQRRHKPQLFGRVTGSDSTIRIIYSFGNSILVPERTGSMGADALMVEDGSFQFDLSSITDFEKLNFITLRIGSDDYYLKDFVVEPSDSIFLQIDAAKAVPTLFFSGRGATKYTCRWQLQRAMRYADSSRRQLNLAKTLEGDLSLERLKKDMRIYDHLKDSLVRILDAFKHQISSTAYQAMLADIRSTESIRLGHFWSVKEKNPTIDAKGLLELFDRSLQGGSIEKQGIGRYSGEYVRYQVEYLTTRLYLEQGQQPTFSQIYQAVQQQYHGEDLWRIQFVMFTNQAPFAHYHARLERLPRSEQVDIIKAALDNTTKPLFKTRFRSILNSIAVGTPAYAFEFEDPQGKRVALKDFSGKYVVMDMWFTGCSACAAIHKKLETMLRPKIKDPSQVVFVSICTDKSKQMWLKSVEKEIYSKKEDINLYTNGQGFNHPIVDYYGLKGLPFVALIDPSGKVLTTVKNAYLNEFFDMAVDRLGE